MQKIVIAVLAVAFFGWLYYSSREQSSVVCEACIVFDGKKACAKAAAATREEALQQVATVACAQVASGMSASIACQKSVPEEPVCTGADKEGKGRN